MQWPNFFFLQQQDTAGLPMACVATYNDSYCPDCFNISSTKECEYCGFNAHGHNQPHLLPAFTPLAGGRYYVGRVLGNPGGFGVVYAGVQTSLSRLVAIKEFFPVENTLSQRTKNGLAIVAASDKARLFDYWKEQFLAEGRLLAGLRHPRIVTVYDFIEENGTYYIVMERLRGCTLADYLEITQDNKKNTIFKRRLSQADAMVLLSDALKALEAMHSQAPKPIMHLDITPGNLFLRGGNIDQAVLIDFGLAGDSANTHASVAEIMVGNAAYMAPEQVVLGRHLSPATDCYSLGACLYAVLTGIAPTSAEKRLGGALLTDIATLVPDLDQTLALVVMHSLSLAPESRPQNAMDMQAQLAGANITLPTKTAPVLMPSIKVITTKIMPPQGGPLAPVPSTPSETELEPVVDPVSNPNNVWLTHAYYALLAVLFPLLLYTVLLTVWYEILVIAVIWKILPINYLFPNLKPETTIEIPLLTDPTPVPVTVPKPLPDPAPTVQPAYVPDYVIDHQNGVVTVTKTGLMWKICSEGQTWENNTCNGEASVVTWYAIMPQDQATTRGEYAGYRDWRVPTSDELLTLVRCSNGTVTSVAAKASCSGKGWGIEVDSYRRPTLDQSIFLNTPSGKFWSASRHNSVLNAAWNIDFRSGVESWGYCTETKHVRLVRTDLQTLYRLKLPTVPE